VPRRGAPSALHHVIAARSKKGCARKYAAAGDGRYSCRYPNRTRVINFQIRHPLLEAKPDVLSREASVNLLAIF
jgi:hypothetical protein